MKELKHLIYFESLLEDTNNELVRKAESEGDLALGYTCFHAPEVLMNLGNCFSVRLRAPHTNSMELATYYMANNSCEFARALLERALEGNYAVGRAEQLCDAQRIAGAAAAVAYGVYAVKAERLVDLVDKAVILGALEHLISLLLADQAVLAVLGEVDGIVVKVHAHILFKMAAALSDQAA